MEFKVTPFSFFQPNVFGAINLYSKAIELCGDIENKVVFDLYSGTGTIGQIVARKAKAVYGIEIVEEAVESANKSAKENELTNCTFIAGDVLEEIENRKEMVDVIIVDPPRDGINQKALEKIISCGAKTIVYISCNPKTQKRDVQVLLENGYELKTLKIFNQFPRTVHISIKKYRIVVPMPSINVKKAVMILSSKLIGNSIIFVIHLIIFYSSLPNSSFVSPHTISMQT